MIDHDGHFLSTLQRAATAAQKEEIAFRNNVGREIENRERARQYAFRRLSIAELMASAARGAEGEEKAIAAQIAAVRGELGWLGDSEQHKRILAAWRPVAVAIWGAVHPPSAESDPRAPNSPPDPGAALAEFEAWYIAEFGTNYLAILDHEMQELPVVEF